jgi:hypothetical protein
MSIMRENGQKPRDFGIRVRNNSADLQITAYNKMRNSTDEYEWSSYFGGIVETPYLCYNSNAHKNNYTLISNLVNKCIEEGHSFERQNDSVAKGRYIVQDIPKSYIIDLIKKLQISKFSSSFDVKQIADFLGNCVDPSIDLFDIAFMDGSSTGDNIVAQKFAGAEIYRVHRTCKIDQDTDRLNIGRRGKLGGPNDGIAGVIDFNGRTALEIVETARAEYRKYYKIARNEEFTKEKNYPSDTWFKFIKDRKPLLLVYFLEIDIDKDDSGQHETINKLKNALGEIPVVGFMLGLPRNDNAAHFQATKFKANKVYNWFEHSEMDIGEEE